MYKLVTGKELDKIAKDVFNNLLLKDKAFVVENPTDYKVVDINLTLKDIDKYVYVFALDNNFIKAKLAKYNIIDINNVEKDVYQAFLDKEIKPVLRLSF